MPYGYLSIFGKGRRNGTNVRLRSAFQFYRVAYKPYYVNGYRFQDNNTIFGDQTMTR